MSLKPATILRAYHGDAKIKKKYLARVARHRRLDHLTQGFGWEKNGTTKGCAVGCTLEQYDHSRYPVELGIPEHIAHLEDAIFEGLPREEAMAWPTQFLSAIAPGADLSLVWPRFAVWLLADPEHGVLRPVQSGSATAKAIIGVAYLYRRRIAGDEPTANEWDAARDAALDAHWRRCAAKLLELLSSAPLGGGER